MTIELGDDPPPEPGLPAGFPIESFSTGLARAFHGALEEAFAGHWEYQPEGSRSGGNDRSRDRITIRRCGSSSRPARTSRRRPVTTRAIRRRLDPSARCPQAAGGAEVSRGVPACTPSASSVSAGRPGRSGRRLRERIRSDEALRERRHARRSGARHLCEGARVNVAPVRATADAPVVAARARADDERVHGRPGRVGADVRDGACT